MTDQTEIQTIVTKDNGERQLPFDKPRFLAYIDAIAQDFPELEVDAYKNKVLRLIAAKEVVPAEFILNKLIELAVESVDVDVPEWQFFAGRLYANKLYKEASKNRLYDAAEKYGSYYGLQEGLISRGVYSSDILDKYSHDEVVDAQNIIDPELDKKLTYLGLRTLAERYLGRDGDGNLFELPQERWLTIAMYLMQNEDPAKRMDLVKEAYWALANLYMTVATPTLANSGKTHGQLSSCFVETVPDSLTGIYDSLNSVAQVSKYGGGIGVYFGFVRGAGASIRGVKGAAGGSIRFIRSFEALALSVDQLGVRRAGIAIYQDIWHPDIEAFLDLRLNNGEETTRAHNLSLGVNIPDLFMEKVEKDGDWYLFDPYEVYSKKGWYLQDSYDEHVGSGSFRQRYDELVADNNVKKKIVKAKDLFKRILKSQLETGYPYIMHRDNVARDNPLKKHGIVYSSQLCSEITQNMSPTTFQDVVIDGDRIVVEKTAGDFVVCNLSSVSLGTAYPDGVLDRLIPIQVRMLDNVIDINKLPVPAASITNKKTRSIGLGTSGFHQLLAKNFLHWESDEAVEFTSKVYEEIAYRTIKASADLAIERGYPELFEGSEWQSGEYFRRNGFLESSSKWDWEGLDKQIREKGVRNLYMIAIAPTGSTSLISHNSMGVDGVTDIFYTEEKKDMRIPVVVPDYSIYTNNYYKPAYQTDQSWSIKHNAVRQKWVDQAISFNLYINNDGTKQGAQPDTPEVKKAVRLYQHHFQIWRSGIKTSYYVRSQTVQNNGGCVWCES